MFPEAPVQNERAIVKVKGGRSNRIKIRKKKISIQVKKSPPRVIAYIN